MVDMGLDGGVAEDEGPGDFGVGQAGGGEPEDLGLPGSGHRARCRSGGPAADRPRPHRRTGGTGPPAPPRRPAARAGGPSGGPVTGKGATGNTPAGEYVRNGG